MKTRNLKTKTLSILLAIVMLLSMLPMSVFAADTEDYITVFNTKVNAGQYFAGGSGEVADTAPTDNYLYYEGGGKITLKNFVHTSTNPTHNIWTDNKDISITLIGQSSVKHEYGTNSITTNNGKLIFSGDGSLYCDAIDCNGFELTGGTVTATGVTSVGDISISGGELTLTHHALKTMGDYRISISGGKVKVSGHMYAIYATSDNGTVSISGGEVELTAVASGYADDKAIYANTLTIGENMQILAGSSAGDAAAVDAYSGEMYVKITPKAKGLIITGGSEGTNYTYDNGVLDIKTAGTYEIKNAGNVTVTDDVIKVSAPSGTVNITLGGVNIATTAGMSVPAFEITGDCKTNITLADNSENILDSWESKEGVFRNYAGLQNGEHLLTISCAHSKEAEHICNTACGSLEAVGGNYAACIGGGYYMSGNNITIHGGNITADFADNQKGHAGIGGGSNGDGNNITISGGNIIASGDTAGIGGGINGDGIGITISGGTVNATGSAGAGIGGGNGGDGSNITISGGTVNATSTGGAGIGGGNEGTAENIVIAPAANMGIYAYNGSDNTGDALAGSPFTTKTDITNLLSGKAFYSVAEHIHSFSTDWTYDDTDHWHTAICCDGVVSDKEAHSGGTATCKEKAICSICNVAYGELAAHNYKYGKCTVCEAADPNYIPETNSPKTGDNSHMALWFALLLLGGAVFTLAVCDIKGRKNTV